MVSRLVRTFVFIYLLAVAAHAQSIDMFRRDWSTFVAPLPSPAPAPAAFGCCLPSSEFLRAKDMSEASVV